MHWAAFLKRAADAPPKALCNEHLIRRYIMFRRILAALMLLGMLGTIAGCNTMRGFGEDVERGGEKIQEKSAR